MIDIQTGMIGALAFAGDLSMGQPPDHSPRTALLTTRLADTIGASAVLREDALKLALLRWTGCTANADGFGLLFGDDVAGRAALIAGQDPFLNGRNQTESLSPAIGTLASIHCDTGAQLVKRLQLKSTGLPAAFADLFESWNGDGHPGGKRGDAIQMAAQLVSLSGDLEVWSRVHGFHKALLMIEETAGSHHDPHLVGIVLQKAAHWMAELEERDSWSEVATEVEPEVPSDLDSETAAYLFADYVDLKIPSLGRLSRSTARVVRQSLEGKRFSEIEQASLVHALGLVSVPNRVVMSNQLPFGPVGESIRIVPHWTERILSRCPQFAHASALAGAAFERLDGSGFHRGLTRKHFNAHCRLLQAASLTSLLIAKGSGDEQALEGVAKALADGVRKGTIDATAVEKITSQLGVKGVEVKRPQHTGAEVSPREQEVLALLSKGLSNKEIARTLGISASTVGTHVESIYRKLEVSNRATATLKALEDGLLT